MTPFWVCCSFSVASAWIPVLVMNVLTLLPLHGPAHCTLLIIATPIYIWKILVTVRKEANINNASCGIVLTGCKCGCDSDTYELYDLRQIT